MVRSRMLIVAFAIAVAASGCAGLAVGAKPSTALPPEKQARENHYASDAAAAKGNEHSRSDDGPPPSDDPNDSPKSGFPTKPAGDGTIIETGHSGPPGTSQFAWQNEWVLKTAGQVISVYAGSRVADPRKGVLFVTVWSADESTLLRQVTIDTPRAAGAVRFVRGNGKHAIVQATDGTEFDFDALSLAVR